MHNKFLAQDKKLQPIVKQFAFEKITKRKNVFINLVKSIVGQQLSVKAAASIYAKFLTLFETKNITPQNVLDKTHDELRSAGLSNSKAQYIKNIAQFWLEHKIEDKHFAKLSDEEIITWLTQIKGVGVWTVEMLLMFTLGREDVFSTGDLGIRQAMCMLFKWSMEDKDLKNKMLNKSKSWSPYRTYACLMLWRSKDEK